ncbi:MAG: site-2 protease family protein [Anaerolineae bacterium]
MLNEPASSLNGDHPQLRPIILPDEDPRYHDPRYKEIRDAVEMVMYIKNEEFTISEDAKEQQADLFMLSRESNPLMTFRGQLTSPSEAAYNTLDLVFKPRNLLPVFREEDGDHVIYVLEGRVRPIEGGVIMSAVLFFLTVLSVLLVGASMAISEIERVDPDRAREMASNIGAELWRGLPYAAGILLILGAHELGHYFMARRHRTAASLPYFLPFPFGLFGTFGAAIRLREPMRNRKVLMDIGAAGPLAGLVFAVPILLIGLATSDVGSAVQFMPPGATRMSIIQEGNSVLYATAKFIVFGRFLPSGGEDVFVNQLAWAGWTGLLVTGLNLIPVGQLDGGHVLYALLGKRAKQLYVPVVAALLALTLFLAPEFLVFALLVVFFGRAYATPLDDITPLDVPRRRVAVLTLLVFVLAFVPMPFNQTIVERGPFDGSTASLGMMGVVALVMVMQRLRR